MYKFFLSYPTAADRRGRISKFKEELEIELQERTGEPDLQFFQDKNDIGIGERWEAKLGDALDTAGYLVPIVQPLFFKSTWCVREVLDFDALCERRGLHGRILPILWLDTPQLEDHTGLTDDAARAATLLAKTQWFDWRSQRLTDWNQDKVLQLGKLGAEITAVLRGPVRPPPPPPPPPPETPPEPPPEALAALEKFLLSAFSPSELRRFLRYRPGDLDTSLPGRGVSPAELTTGAVDLLRRRRLLDADFFAALERERPYRAKEVMMLATRFRR